MNVRQLSFAAAGLTMAASIAGLLPAGPAAAATPKCTTTMVMGSSEAGAGFMTVPWGGGTTRCSLSEGAKNTAVTALQRMMYYCYSEKSLSADGDFGPATKAALKRTQTKIGASSDGQYGPETASKIDGVGDSGCGRFPAK
ncbi:peptidoglycan-binding domain-containing protein [Actinoplanes sp. NPDC048796]|uniref:peptidoglycan-binding domain-containing protein n=1 Tax=unclassified Actinoplanes TaxID=2626549 RepID=UPI0033F8AE54